MILEISDIKEILKTKPTASVWTAANSDRKKLQMHLLGVGLKEYITKIDGVESTTLNALRKNYAKSNRDLFARVLRPVDGIWDARGGGVYYQASESISNKLKEMVMNVSSGYNIRKWVRNFVYPRLLDDPMGVVLMEVSANAPNVTYPTYKSSADILDAKLSGRSLEYLVLRTDKTDTFRVIDDISDRMVQWDGTKIRTLDRFPNPFMKVPAVIISDIPKMGMDGQFESPVENEIELAHEYLVNGSISRIYEFKHGFPKEWRYPLQCQTCHGTGLIQADNCKACNGTGKGTKDNPDNVWVFGWPAQDQPEIAEKGGYINPSIEYLQHVKESQKALEGLIFQTHWGTHQVEDGMNSETATGRFIDTQPVNNRLSLYASLMEDHEKFITDHIGQINFQTSFKGASVSYGRRFIIEAPDELLKKYMEARTKGVAMSTLDDLYFDYLEAKFQNQPLELDRQMKLMKVEPFFHLTLDQAQKVVADPELYKMKLMFGEWATMAVIAGKSVEVLKEELKVYASQFETPVPPEPAKPKGQFN